MTRTIRLTSESATHEHLGSVLPIDLLNKHFLPATYHEMLPPVVRFISDSVFVVERLPMRINIRYLSSDKYAALKREHTSEDIYNIPLPWMVYFVDINQDIVTFGCRSTSLSSLSDDIYYFPLPNMVNMHCPWPVMCRSSTSNSSSTSVSERITNIFSAGFNDNADDGLYGPYASPFDDTIHNKQWTEILSYYQSLTIQEVLDMVAIEESSNRERSKVSVQLLLDSLYEDSNRHHLRKGPLHRFL